MSEKPKIFIHIGAPGTGATFLQRCVFPFWPNVEYSVAINELWFPYLVLMNKDKKYIVSNEKLFGFSFKVELGLRLDWHAEREHIFQALSKLFPDAQILVSFRDHVDFILSLYEQYLDEGGTRELSSWFDIDNDNSEMKREEFLYMRTIEHLENCFGRKPFVFTLEKIEKDLQGLLEKFGKLFGEKCPDIDLGEISLLRAGVGRRRAKLLRLLNIVEKSSYSRPLPKGFLHLANEIIMNHTISLRYIYQRQLKKSIKRPIKFERTHEQEIREYYRPDWLAVNEYVRNFAFPR